MVWCRVSRKQKASWQQLGDAGSKMCFPKREKRDIGLHPRGLRALYLPSIKMEAEAQSQGQRQQWFDGWGTLHV